MAEFLFKNYVKNKGKEKSFLIESAATSTEEIGNGVHYGTKRILNSLGIDCSNKRARQITKSDYGNFDYLMVNSDQTWVNITPNFLPDIGFLKFAINWNIPKFIYGASYPLDEWRYSEKLSHNLGLLLKKINGQVFLLSKKIYA